MTAITPTGFVRSRLDERIAELTAATQAIFGPDLDLDPDTIDGQTLGIYAESISNLDQLAESIYQGFNPQTATGNALSRLVQFNAIRRLAGAHSTVTLTFTGTNETVIPVGSLISSTADKSSWQTLTEVTIPESGTITAPAQSVEMGAITADHDTLTKIDTPIYGWQTVTNLAAATAGRLEETDETLRIRRKGSTLTPATAVVDSIYGVLSNLPNVTHVRVIENDQDETDLDTGLPPHSIRCIVKGGDETEIAQKIRLKKTVGATLIGDQSVDLLDSQGYEHAIKFDRPTDVLINVKITLTPQDGYAVDAQARIKAALVAFALNYKIGDPVSVSRLYTPINTVPDFIVTSLYIARSPTTPTSANTLTMDVDEIPTISLSSITIIES